MNSVMATPACALYINTFKGCTWPVRPSPVEPVLKEIEGFIDCLHWSSSHSSHMSASVSPSIFHCPSLRLFLLLSASHRTFWRVVFAADPQKVYMTSWGSIFTIHTFQAAPLFLLHSASQCKINFFWFLSSFVKFFFLYCSFFPLLPCSLFESYALFFFLSSSVGKSVHRKGCFFLPRKLML